MQRITEMTDSLHDQTYELQESDGHLTRKPIEKGAVFYGKLTVEFKSGVQISIAIE